ncbi:MAG: HAD family hydrolase [Anaerolineaceae bacterium]|jgi:epoxide hydrolase-like predicted phosphatase
MINTVIFDFGGVLFPLEGVSKVRHKLAWIGVKKDDPFLQMYEDPDNSPVFWELMRGTIKEIEFWQDTFKRWKVPGWLNHIFLKRLIKKQKLDDQLLEFMVQLKGRVKLGILSNAGDTARLLMEKTYKLNELVDEIIISAEEGFAKPERELYQIALERLKTQAEETVFVDDLPQNIAVAQELGFKTVLHKNSIATIQEVKKILERVT